MGGWATKVHISPDEGAGEKAGVLESYDPPWVQEGFSGRETRNIAPGTHGVEQKEEKVQVLWSYDIEF